MPLEGDVLSKQSLPKLTLGARTPMPGHSVAGWDGSATVTLWRYPVLVLSLGGAESEFSD